jgi:hypothetical protein
MKCLGIQNNFSLFRSSINTQKIIFFFLLLLWKTLLNGDDIHLPYATSHKVFLLYYFYKITILPLSGKPTLGYNKISVYINTICNFSYNWHIMITNFYNLRGN